ncbi:MAG: elongation factor G [Spirochaetaceae bacterium]|jgi:elongation factor G|nr:elongation factor G [Spirochaetaceae bacterium]
MGYRTDAIRNIAVCGHVGTGKTSLVEQILSNSGIIAKAEKVETGRTISDYTEEEIEKQMSIHTSLIHFNWEEHKINLFDTPGAADFVGEVVASFRAAESAVVLIGARSSLQIETIKLWRRLDNRDMPRVVFVNKMDKERADYFKVLADLEGFKMNIIPITIPMGQAENFKGVINLLDMKAYPKGSVGKKENAEEIPEEYKAQAEEYHQKLIEQAAMGDDQLTEKYFDKDDLTIEEAIKGLSEGLFDNKFIPVFCGSAEENSGIVPLMNFMAYESPAPGRIEEPCKTGESSVMVSSDGDFSAIVFKTSIDKFAGKMSFVKIITGVLKAGMESYDPRNDEKIRINKVFFCEGKNLKEVNDVIAGDIAILTKIDSLHTNDTLCPSDKIIHFKSLALPHPVYNLAISAKNKKDEDKLSDLLHRVAEQDLTFFIKYNEETHETVISGMGELHIITILEKIFKEAKIEVDTKVPQIPYRETIMSNAEAEYTHKKQSGGHGQYGRVSMRIHPLERGQNFLMSNDVKGGSISKGYMPGIEKGLLEGMQEGFLAGYPMVDVGVSIYDGKEHPVDSSEMAFKLAAKNGIKTAFEKAKPTLLEPVMELTVFVENKYLGDVLSDLSTKRGRVLDQGPMGSGIQSIKAQVPQAELMRYSIDLKSMTSGTGAFELEFSHYDPVGGKTAQDIIKARNTSE